MIITIDGPAGTGKTTIAKRVAKKLGFSYFDTGAMYRAVTYKILKEKIPIVDRSQLKQFLVNFKFSIKVVNGMNRYLVDNEDITDQIRSTEVTKNVSTIAAIGEVRETVVEMQKKFAALGDAVFEGRDMGTVVFPDAKIKVFLTARSAVRAERRYLEIKDKIGQTTQEEIMRELLERDNFDTTREISPLKQAGDAILIDTSDMTIDQVEEMIISFVK